MICWLVGPAASALPAFLLTGTAHQNDCKAELAVHPDAVTGKILKRIAPLRVEAIPDGAHQRVRLLASPSAAREGEPRTGLTA